MTYPLVEVKWEDAWSSGSHRDPDDKFLTEPAVTTSVGFLLKRKPRLVLAQSMTQAQRVYDTLTIPKGCVKKIKRLKHG